MALLRRGFSLYESLDRIPIDVIRSDLKRLGLAPNVSRIQLFKQYLVDAPIAQQSQTPPDSTSPPLPDYLKPFSANYLERAIRQKAPYSDLSKVQGVLQLTEILKGEMTQGKGKEVSDLRTLLGKLKAGEQVELSEMKLVLPKLIDLEWLPQLDWNLIRGSNPDSLIPMWQSLFTSLLTLSKDEFIWLLRAISVNTNSIGMNFQPGSLSLDGEVVKKAVEKEEGLIDEMSYQDLRYVFEFLKQFHVEGEKSKEAKQVREVVLKRLEEDNIETMTYRTLNDVFFMLPDECFEKHAAVISSLMGKLFPSNKDFDPEYAWQCIETAQRLQAPIPRPLLHETSIITIAYLSRLSPSKLLTLVDDLIKCDMLTSNIVNQIIDMYSISNGLIENYSTLVEFNYKLHRAGLHALTHKKMYIAQILCTRSDFRLSIEQLLKTGISLYPHMCGDSLSRRMLEDFSSVPLSRQDLPALTPMMSELLGIVSNSCSEKPIYTYQYFSMENVSSSMKIRLAEKLVSLILELKGDTKNVWRHFGHALGASTPPEKLLSKTLTGKVEEAGEAAFCLWRHKAAISSVSTYAEALLSHPRHDFQSLYYLQKLLPPNSTLPLFRSLLSQPVSSPNFFLPLCEELGINLQTDNELRSFFEEKVEKEVCLMEVFGAALYQSILQMNKLGRYKEIAIMSQCLSFIPKIESPISSEILEQLTLALATSRLHCSLNFKCISLFFEAAIANVSPSDKLLANLSTLFASAKSDIPKSIEEKLANRNLMHLLQTNDAFLAPLLSKLHIHSNSQQFKQACHFLQPSESSADVLQALETARVLLPEFTGKFLFYIENKINPGEKLFILKRLLSYFAIVGIEPGVFAAISNSILNSKLLDSLDMQSVINLAFLYLCRKGEGNAIPELVVERFKAVLPIEDNEYLVASEIPGMQRYLPFTYSSILEPRLLASNDYQKRSEINFNRSIFLSSSDSELLLKIHTIRNALKLETSSLIQTALTTMKAARENCEEVKEFGRDIDEVISSNRLQGMKKDIVDDKLLWTMEAGITSSRLGIMLYLDQDTVRNSSGAEVSVIYPKKIIKEQLERFSGWRITGVRFSVWRNLSLIKKIDLIQHMAKKYAE